MNMPEAIQDMAFSGDGKCVVAILGEGTGVKVWDATTGQEQTNLKHPPAGTSMPRMSPDGKQIVGWKGGRPGTVRNAQTGQELVTLRSDEARLRFSLAFSPDGRWIVSGGQDHTVNVWDAQTGAAVATLRGHTDRVLTVRFSPDGKHIASGSSDGSLKLWNWKDVEHKLQEGRIR
jgi:WD40 repeat protein